MSIRFLVTANTGQSRWCPWELGYADGTKENKKIVVIGTCDQHGIYGNEYLDLYRRISKVASLEKYALYEKVQSNGTALQKCTCIGLN